MATRMLCLVALGLAQAADLPSGSCDSAASDAGPFLLQTHVGVQDQVDPHEINRMLDEIHSQVTNVVTNTIDKFEQTANGVISGTVDTALNPLISARMKTIRAVVAATDVAHHVTEETRKAVYGLKVLAYKSNVGTKKTMNQTRYEFEVLTANILTGVDDGISMLVGELHTLAKIAGQQLQDVTQQRVGEPLKNIEHMVQSGMNVVTGAADGVQSVIRGINERAHGVSSNTEAAANQLNDLLQAVISAASGKANQFVESVQRQLSSVLSALSDDSEPASFVEGGAVVSEAAQARRLVLSTTQELQATLHEAFETMADAGKSLAAQ